MIEINSQQLNNSMKLNEFQALLDKHGAVAITLEREVKGICVTKFDGDCKTTMSFSKFKKISKRKLRKPVAVLDSGKAINQQIGFYYVKAGA